MPTFKFFTNDQVQLFTQLTTDGNGNTPLHQAIEQFNYPQIKMILSGSDQDELIEQACTVNDDNILPIDLVESRSDFSLTQKARIEHALQALMLKKPCKPLTELIDPQAVLGRYNKKQLSAHADELRIGCEIINQIRSNINNSATHPDANHLSEWNRHNLDRKTEELRDEHTNSRSYALKSKLITEQALGSCFEMAILAKTLCKKRYPYVYTKMAYLHNGDHAFLQIGFHVICDPWLGDVFLKEEIESKLKSFTTFDDLNHIVNYNPRLHQVRYYR